MRVRARMSVVSRQVIANRMARRAASDPSTPIAELIKLGEWWPSEVRANPAWQLASVADAAVARATPDAMIAESVQTVPLDDAACIRACDAWVQDPTRLERTIFALASHAEAPGSWLRNISIHAPPDRCISNGIELALYRSRIPDGEYHGWAAAMIPAMELSLRSKDRAQRFAQRGASVAALLHHGAVDLSSPFSLVAAAFGGSGLIDSMIAHAPAADDRWIDAIAGVKAGFYPSPAKDAWRLCIALWLGMADRLDKVPRFRVSGFAEGMGLQWKASNATQIAADWRAGKRPSSSAASLPSLDDAVLQAACSGPSSGALMLLLSAPICPKGLLWMHARNREPCVRAAVASNPATPVRLRERLARDWHWIVRGAALGHEPWSENMPGAPRHVFGTGPALPVASGAPKA